MHSLYFDHAATTRPHASVVACVLETLEDNFANPSSLHRQGLFAERLVEEARVTLAEALFCDEDEIVFTSGGTEANFLALAGTLRTGDTVLTTPLEHASIRVALDYLRETGVSYQELALLPDGTVDPAALEEALTPDVRLVSLQHVNNETGLIQPLEKLARIVKKKDPTVLLHSDGIQAFGKFASPIRAAQLDLYSVSGHKIGGMKGTGALYIRRNTRFTPVMAGGGQEGGRRGGTQNVPGIAGFACAVREWNKNQDAWTAHSRTLRAAFWEKLQRMEGVRVQSPDDGSPFILSVGFSDTRGEVLLHMLEQKGISVSTGSACSKGTASRVLQKLGYSDKTGQGTVRISFGPENTMEDVNALAEAVSDGVAFIRKMTRSGQ